MENIAQKYEFVKESIKKKCNELNIYPLPKIILVTKNQSIDKLQKAYDLGIRDFGENKAQELVNKVKKLPKNINWHFIGKLQTNKVGLVVELVDCIHSVDSLKLVQHLQKKSQKLGKIINLFLQVNLSQEKSKIGFLKEEIEKIIFYVKQQSHLKLLGLMTIGKKDAPEEFNRNLFIELKNLGQKFDLFDFSMGMSSDYLFAIESSATNLRLGSCILGNRV